MSLLGWLTEIPLLTSICSCYIPMLPNSAILYDIVSHLFLETHLINPSVVYGINTIIFLGITGLIVLLVSRMVGGSIDSANAMRARTEAALRESEERFRTMFEVTGDGIILAERFPRYQDAKRPKKNYGY